jgi:hypothetical protein
MLTMDQFLDEVTADMGRWLADELVRQMREVCSVPGSPDTPARPYAPPRRITGKLIKSIRRRGRTVVVEAPYAGYLEFGTARKGFPHAFVDKALKKADVI